MSAEADRVLDDCPCRTGYIGRITAGDLSSGPHASVYVCASLLHQAAAREHVTEFTGGLSAEYAPLPRKKVPR